MDNINPKIYCVIPAWNEENNIATVINKLKGKVDKIIVVDDGSKDRTYEIAKKNGVVALRHFINRGQGAALQTGNNFALKDGADIIVHFDADDQFDADEIKDVVSPLVKQDYEVVLGSRFLGKTSEMPAIKSKILFPMARLTNRLFFKIKFSDPQIGFRAFKKEVADKIYITQDEFAHCTEILNKIVINNLKVKEVPVTVSYKRFGQSMSGGLKIIKDLIFTKIVE